VDGMMVCTEMKVNNQDIEDALFPDSDIASLLDMIEDHNAIVVD
jgi:hypothetical protein